MAKPASQEFTQQWDKTVDWAKQNNIPYSAYYPVYQLDSQRFLSGSPMSESERIRAIQAAAGENYSTALPTDNPNPANVPKNVGTNLQNIFTGLEGIFTGGFEKNVWDTVTNTLEHPSTVYGAFDKIPTPWMSQASAKQYMDNLSNHITAQHNALAYVPGLYDLAQVNKPGGAKNLLTQPITSLLDVLPLGRTIPKSIADSTAVDSEGFTLGDRVSQKLGVTKEQLAKMEAIQFTYKLSKTLHLPGEKGIGVMADASGSPIGIKPVTIGERIENYRRVLGTSSTQADLLKGAILKGEKGTKAVEKILAPVDRVFNNLNDNDRTMAMRALADDHRPETDVVNDAKYPLNVQTALQAVYDYGHTALSLKLQAGTMINVETPFGVESYTVEVGTTVQRAKDFATRAQTTLDKASKPFDALTYKIQNADAKMTSAFDILQQQVTAIYASIKRTIPELGNETQLAKLRSTLPVAERWDRAVAEQTPLLKNLLGLGKDDTLTLHAVNSLRDLFQPNGLLDQMDQAFKDQDWIALSKYSKTALRKFDAKVFDKIPRKDNAFLLKVKVLTKNIHDYAVQRERDVNAMTKMLDGTRHGDLMANGKFVKNSIMGLTKRSSEANQHFVDVAIHHPPDLWRNTFLSQYVDQLMSKQSTAGLVDEASHALLSKGYGESEVEKMAQDPRTIIELMARSAKNTLENNMMPDIEYGAAMEAREDAFKELASLRAKGPEYAPAYIPSISPHDVVRGLEGGYNVYIGNIVPKSVASTFKRAFEFTSSVYDVQLAIRKDALDQMTKDVTQEFVDEYVTPQLHEGGPLREIIAKYMAPEIARSSQEAMDTGVRAQSVDAIIESQLKRMNLVKVDLAARFGSSFSTSRLMNADHYIDANLMSAIDKTLDQFQFPAEGFWDRGTKLFRFSILGLSPRYTMHILAGGTALVAYRGHLSMAKFLGNGWHVATNGQLPDEVYEQAHGFAAVPRQAIRDFRVARHTKNEATVDAIRARFPRIDEAVSQSAAAQEGQADVLFHRAAGYTIGNKMIAEEADKFGGAKTVIDWVKHAATVNMRFTRGIVHMQQTITYLDGATRAMKEGSFNELVSKPELDSHGEQIVNSTTGKPQFKQVEQKSDMTPDQAHEAGMHAMAQVMGDIRHMTPLERQWLVRAFPFYGWTKHILTYVLTYPIDHPYRAMVLSQLATQASADVPSGLPTRIQLLFFLGQPDAQGNVSAIDARVFDPLRDTANYASITGFFQSLNPILSAPVAYLDPQSVFGSNELYPNLSYSDLYGGKEAGPQGNAYTVAEQFVPQLTALDEAFNLSSQYAYLKNSGDLSKKLYQSLNVPFFQVQHLNLRQMAAQNELDRYSVASTAAYEYATGSDPNALAGYPSNSNLPDPLNTEYNITPAYLEAMQQESESTEDMPYYETATPPPNPAL